MMLSGQQAIVINDNSTDIAYVVPIRPINGELAYSDGDKMATTVNILDVGSVDIPTGVELDSVSWDSFFPGQYDPNFCDVDPGSLMDPLDYRNLFSTWKDAGTSLQIITPLLGLNKTMYLQSFKPKAVGADGDVFYSVTFKELKKLTPKKLTPGGQPIAGKQPEDRNPVPEPAKPKTYTVQSGDMLILIGKKLGVDWHDVYAANKSLIGPNPNLIQSGQVLTIS